MKRVLIVDDEPMIRAGLPLLIDWKKFHFEIVGVAKDGIDGLKKIEDLKPDLVITDIRMPLMDGLAMIRSATEKGFVFHSIILSGFSEFEYAREALVLGAVSYLLKPVNEKELEELLHSVSAKINDTETQSLQQELTNKLFGQDPELLNDYHWAKDICMVNTPASESLQNQIKAISTPVADIFFIPQHEYLHILLLVKDSVVSSTLNSSLDYYLNKSHHPIFCSDWHNTEQPLSLISEQIQQLKTFRFFFPEEVISSSKIEKYHTRIVQKSLLEEINTLVMVFDHEKHFETVLEDFWQEFCHTSFDESELKWELIRYLSHFSELVAKRFSLSPPKNLVKRTLVMNTETLPQLKQAALTVFKDIRHFYIQENNQVDIVERVKNYANTHLGDELNLKILGQIFTYNSTYLGKKFKKDTGQTFTNYLDQIRMEQAKLLLETTQLLVYEIANQVGFEKNIDYFYKKFKNHFQASPNDFRK